MEKVDKIWLDGKFLNWDDANVHILTHTLHYGVGAFEGIRAYGTPNGRTSIFRFKDHMKRLYDSARLYFMDIPYTMDELMDATKKLIRMNKLMDGCYIRPLVFMGNEKLGLYTPDNSIRVGISTWVWGAYLGEEGLKNGIKGKVSSYSRGDVRAMFPKAKISGNYINSVLAKREAKYCGFDEAVMLDTSGYVSECSGENIFLVKNGEILTPTEGQSMLGGITRETVLALAKDNNIPVRETLISRDMLYLADEIFIVGTAAEVTPMSSVDNRSVGTGKPGPITALIQKRYFEVVKVTDPNYHPEWYTFV